MTELTRWSLKVSRETDFALRTLLARRGDRKGDLSRFVEEAVNRAMLRETIRDVQANSADTDPAEIERMITDDVGASRRSFWSEDRR